MAGQRDELERLARTWLAPGIADRFLGLLRPAIRLFASGPDDRPVGQLGGQPALPDGMPWPVWADDEPLPFVFGVAFDRLVGYDIDISLPAAGAMLVFRSDADMGRDPEPGTRLIYVPPGTAVTHRAPPPRTYAYPLRPLAARTVLTWPHISEPALMAEFGSFSEARRLLWERQHDGQYFDDALWRHELQVGRAEPKHQIGGYADAVQNSIVYQAAGAALGHYNYEDASFATEAAMWTALLQIGEDTAANMIWGDGALLYWAVRTTDLSAGNFGRVYFESQGH